MAAFLKVNLRNEAPAPLAAQFGAASMAGAASALALAQRAAGETASARRLETLAMLATGVELLASRATERAWAATGLERSITSGAPAVLNTLGGKAVGVALPIAAHGIGRAAGGRAGALLPELASLAVILGGAAMRHAVLLAGNDSACRPEHVFRTTQAARPGEVRR